MSVKKYLTLSGLTYFFNKIKTYLTSSTYLNSIGIIPNNDNSVDLGDSSKNIKMIYTKGITINGTQFLPSDYATLSGLSTVATSGSYNDLSNKPTTMTPTSHTHGNITNDGKIGSNANKPLITTTGGTVTTGSFGTTANTFCEGNDSRLSDARTPTAHTHSASDITSGLATVATSGSYNDLSNKPTIPTVNDATLTIQKNGTTVKTFTANASSNVTANITVPTKTSDLTNDSGFLTSHQDLSGYVPRSGGPVMAGRLYCVDGGPNFNFGIGGGTTWANGGYIELFSYNFNSSTFQGVVRFQPAINDSTYKQMNLYPSGTWTWNGTACQIISDQRLKQQITEIDDKLLDAWEDVELSQFKYNDAVDQKKDKARLHTGYVVQQIDEACKSHNVDISEYGLYCHEVYQEETEEVEVEQADGTKTKEIKVIREANEHYSLRYTEVYAVECMYLRRCIARLTARIEELEKGNSGK